ncbi:hypothetical protein [Myxococcus virescens]|uniref:Uncharacterized protein n=1 Tax=Myxococcus virescens TaxID=83456 RepID=A0A511H447_9BACT|nr:hypothetical protein [Myxococcus virescens]GEL68316.1 hypothetical protein MVI01_01000 [Myxococcus virescens]SDE97002.1 hypothetical protein SAMN04488504_1163 [Myxococcus virescens]
MAEPGAQAALRGYRLQALYTLYRMLQPADAAKVFRLEGREDLDILDESGRVLEVIQMKAYGAALTLSALKPEKPESFFRRVLKRRVDFPDAQECIVSFGPYGQEMQAAWSGSPAHRAHAVELLEGWKYSPVQAQVLLSRVKLLSVNEEALKASISASLLELMTGCDPVSAFDLLHAWLFQASEARATLTRSQLIERLNAVGRFLRDRDAYQAEWFSTVHPLLEIAAVTGRENLGQEFYQGVSARFEHVLAGVDVIRPARLDLIETAFQKSRVVVIQGASGQGKSALAYRFLHDRVPSVSRFEVRLVQDRRHARNIAQALRGYVDAIGGPTAIYVYLDVTPGDTAWTDVVQSLHEHLSVRILITLREEDWLRASISRADLRFEEIRLQLDAQEAQSIHASFLERQPSAEHLDFEDAWRRFGGGGPLLEFTYLLTHHDTLHARLEHQVGRISDEVHRGERPVVELELLRRVAVASAYGARLDLVLLGRELGLAEPRLTVRRLEREFLIRSDMSARWIEGLHPVRSGILVGLLTDPVFHPWGEVATRSLPQMVESDLGGFLLYAFSRHAEAHGQFQHALSKLRPASWEGIAHVFRALIWWGLDSYVARNAAVIAEAKARSGSAWWIMLNSDVANVRDIAPELNVNPILSLDIVPEERKQSLRELQARQSEPREILDVAGQWLRDAPLPREAPSSPEAWASAAETIFHAARIGVPLPALEALLETYADVVDVLPLETAAEVAYACSFHQDVRVAERLTLLRPRLLERFRREARIVRLEDDEHTLKAHFILIRRTSTDLVSQGSAGGNKPHEEAIGRARLLSKLQPGRQVYATQGYGHRVRFLPESHDESIKNIRASYLPPVWATRLNQMYLNRVSYQDRPETWEAHAVGVLALRRDLMRLMQRVHDALERYFRGAEAVSLVQPDQPVWDAYEVDRERIAQGKWYLPRTAVDEWGWSSEESEQSNENDQKRREYQLALVRHQPYVRALGNYERALSNFLKQVLMPLMLYPLLVRGTAPQAEVARAILRQRNKEEPDLMLPMFNLADAIEELPAFQREFSSRLARFLAPHDLVALETQETEMVRAVRALWLLFITAPERGRLKQPLALAHGRVEKGLDRIRTDLRSRLSALPPQQATARLLETDAPWAHAPALWVVLDMDTPLKLHTAREAVFKILRAVCSSEQISRPFRDIVRTTWRHVVIVPTFCGRAFEPNAWVLSMLTLLADSSLELGWWNHFLYQIPGDKWDELGLMCWSSPRLSCAEDLQKAVVHFSQLLDGMAQISDAFNGMELDSTGLAVLKEDVSAKLEVLSEACVGISSAVERMLRFLGEITPEEAAARPSLAEVIQGIQRIMEPFVGIGTMDPTVFDRLHAAQSDLLAFSEHVRMHWLADVMLSSHGTA